MGVFGYYRKNYREIQTLSSYLEPLIGLVFMFFTDVAL